jgi:transposase
MTLEEQAAALSRDEIVAVLRHNQELAQQTADLQRQVEWFKRQLFGRKSERRLLTPDAQQLPLAGLLPWGEGTEDAPPPPTETVKAYQRRLQRSPGEDLPDEPGLRFDSSVPVEVIAVPNPAVAGLAPHEYGVIGEKITYRLAQRPGAYVILKYVRTVVKRKETETLSCPPAPPAVLERSFADVSLLAGLLVDKLRYHLPLYRQHQRLADAGIRVSRATLTQWVHRTAALLEPVYHALLSSILQSQVLAMDETPIKAGRHEKGKLHTGYFWPIYGDQDEIAFPFAASRAQTVVREALGSFCGILLTDGYTVYERYAQTINGLVHAQCWSRRATGISGGIRQADCRYVLCLVGAYAAGAALVAHQPLHQSCAVCPGAEGRLTSVSGVSERPPGYEPSGARNPRHCHGPQGVALLLDGSWGAVCRHGPESHRLVSAAGCRSVCLPRGCAPAD